MLKKLENCLSVVPFENNTAAMRVTRIVYIDEQKDESKWDQRVGIVLGHMNDNYEFEETSTKLELTISEAKLVLSDSIISKMYSLVHDPRSALSWSDLIEIPDWLYVNEPFTSWWHEIPKDSKGKWIKYRDYLANRKLSIPASDPSEDQASN